MSALQNEINRLNSLKESFHELSSKVLDTQAVLTELNNGKQEMVDALATKNVQSSTTKTLSAIASDIRSIAQSPVTVDGGEMYEKQLFGAPTDKTNSYAQPDSPTWNLYQVMANLLSDGRFVNYGGIVLAEYDKLEDTIQLDTAGSGGCYLTSDGKLYTEDVTHTWDDLFDGKVNRWVAVCFASVNHDYSINDISKSPLSIHIGRQVGNIVCTTNTKLRELVVTDGNKLNSFTGDFTGMWNRNLIIKNVGNFNVYRPSIDYIYAEVENLNNIIVNTPTLVTAILKQTSDTKLETLVKRGSSSYQLNSVKYVSISGVKTILCSNGGIAGFGDSSSTNIDKVLVLHDTEILESTGIPSSIFSGKSVKKLYLYSIERIDSHTRFAYLGGGFEYVYIGYKDNDASRSIIPYSSPVSTLKDIELKHGYRKTIDISRMSNALTAENIALHILDRLADNTDAETLTCVLGTENLATINADETYSSYVALAQAKNWTIS